MITLRNFSLALLLTLAGSAHAEQRPDSAVLIAQQKEALQRFSALDGEWRGDAWHLGEDGKRHALIHTERVGTMLDGSVRVIEGRSFAPDGTPGGFNAFAVMSWDAARQTYNFRSHAMGHAGDFTLVPTEDGFYWEIPAGPATMRYTATVKDGTWHEIGERVMAGSPTVQIFEMTLKHIGDSTWPEAGAVAPTP